MAARKQIDWEAIEREYRAGQLSLREIAIQFNVSHPGIVRRAKSYGWSRDLSKRVRQRVTAQLVTNDVTITNAGNEEEIINQAASRALEVIKLHREDSKKQQDIIRRLMKILDERINTPDLKPTMDDVRYCGGIMRDCSQAFSKLVGIERQAYGIDTDGRRPDPVDEVTITFVEARVEG